MTPASDSTVGKEYGVSNWKRLEQSPEKCRKGVVAFLKTHLPPGDRALPSRGAWCPWLGQERKRLTKTLRACELHYLLPHDSSHNDVTVPKNHSLRASAVNVNG